MSKNSFKYVETYLPCTKKNLIDFLEKNFKGVEDSENYKYINDYLNNEFEKDLEKANTGLPKYSIKNIRESIFKSLK